VFDVEVNLTKRLRKMKLFVGAFDVNKRNKNLTNPTKEAAMYHLALFLSATLCIATLTLISISPAGSTASLSCPNYPDTVFLGDFPADSSPGWTNNIQGVAHDSSNWFFTTQSDAFLIKFPVAFNLTTEFDPEDSDTWPPGAMAVPMPPILALMGYEEMKDLDQAKGFLFVPVDDPDDGEQVTGIAVFRSSDLHYLGFYQITAINHTSFAAFNPHDDHLYVSRPTVGAEPLRRYMVDFLALENEDVENAFSQGDPFQIILTEGGGPIDPPLGNLQGGTFTPWGDLYLVNGGDDPPSADRGGIHLFNSSGQLIDESTNDEDPSTAFEFTYDPEPCDITDPASCIAEEPEGADWWNRDVGPTSPGISGQLHVILLDNDASADELYFKHYSVDYSCIAAEDADGDGLTNGEEIYNTGTDPRKADTDGDQLSDGVELNVLGTNPLDTDSDDDSVLDGNEDADEDGLSNAAEVNLYGTDPTDRDTDDDQLSDGEEVALGTNPQLADSDGDGLLDGQDVEFIEKAVQALPDSSFSPPGQGTRTSILSQLEAIEGKLLAGDVEEALEKLAALRKHVDGCGTAPDGNDWIRNCADQIKIRALIDLLITNLTA
jgi:hypothetical protein